MNKALGEFLTRKYLEYQLAQGKPVYVREFAEYLGVPPTSYSNWINTGITPSARYIDKLAAKLGTEVYDVVGMARPGETIPIDHLPTVVQHQLSEFVAELSLALSGVDPESVEAMEITRSVMDKFGFKFKENS